jgi:hypothetical protein
MKATCLFAALSARNREKRKKVLGYANRMTFSSTG